MLHFVNHFTHKMCWCFFILSRFRVRSMQRHLHFSPFCLSRFLIYFRARVRNGVLLSFLKIDRKTYEENALQSQKPLTSRIFIQFYILSHSTQSSSSHHNHTSFPLLACPVPIDRNAFRFASFPNGNSWNFILILLLLLLLFWCWHFTR